MTSQILQPFFVYVEDDELSRMVMVMMFEKAMNTKNYVIYKDSVDFIKNLHALPLVPDVILLDVHVRPYDSFEMLGMLRAQTSLHNCCVVALTASVMNEEIEQLRLAGFNGAIGKPISATTFPGFIERLLKGNAVWQV